MRYPEDVQVVAEMALGRDVGMRSQMADVSHTTHNRIEAYVIFKRESSSAFR